MKFSADVESCLSEISILKVYAILGRKKVYFFGSYVNYNAPRTPDQWPGEISFSPYIAGERHDTKAQVALKIIRADRMGLKLPRKRMSTPNTDQESQFTNHD